MSRTDELRSRGAKSRSGGGGEGGTPFLVWGDSYAWVEGQVMDLWSTKYGPCATLKVQARSEGLQAQGQGEDGERYSIPVEVGDGVNVSVHYKALEGAVTEEDKGKSLHIAFEGWQQGQNNRYRVFTVLEVPKPGRATQPADAPGGGDGLPF